MSIPIEGYEETCSNCRFFLDHEEEDGLLGTCRRYPPTLALPLRSSPYDQAWIQPVTEADDWCGEHQVEIDR